MNITAHEDLGGRWLLWDGDTYLADCGAGIEGKEKAEAIQASFVALREDNAMLLSVLREVDFDFDKLSPRNQRLLNRIQQAEHPGRTLTKRMSDLERERDAALEREQDLLAAAEQAWRALLERTPHSVPGGEQACEALHAAIVKSIRK